MVKKYSKHISYIIAEMMLLMLFFLLFPSSYVDAEELPSQREAGTFEEFMMHMEQLKTTGGTICLTQDITLPEDQAYTYNNGRYRKEIVVETNGHTIFVDGYLELWPYLTIRGNGGVQEIFRVRPGGELRMTSICIDAGENGTAVIQEAGSFLLYGSEENMGLPPFSCIGNIVESDKITAAAYSWYDFSTIPIVRIPEGSEFTADLLPQTVKANVNRDHGDYEEDIAVVWDKTTFPSESLRTLVSGSFTDEYAQYEDYKPVCLVVWESSEYPYFLNVYLESIQSYDSVFMHGCTSSEGTVYIQASDDGENWNEITGTEGYEPIPALAGDNVDWMLSYGQSDAVPRYYRLMQMNKDGTVYYSDIIELTGDYIFTGSDIEGGRGGEVSPGEGDNQLPGQDESQTETETETEVETEKVTESVQQKEETAVSEDDPEISQGAAEDSSDKHVVNKKSENKRKNTWSVSQQVEIEEHNQESESDSSLISGESSDESQQSEIDRTTDISESQDSSQTTPSDDLNDQNCEGVGDTLIFQIITGSVIMIIILSIGIVAAVWFNKKQ